MRALIGFLVLMVTGIGCLVLSKSQDLMQRATRFTRTPERAVKAVVAGAMLVIMLSLICLSAFIAWYFGEID